MKTQDYNRSTSDRDRRDGQNRQDGNYAPTSYSGYDNGYDYDEAHMRNLNADHTYSNQYDEPRNYRHDGYDNRGDYAYERNRNDRDRWDSEYYNNDNRNNGSNYDNSRNYGRNADDRTYERRNTDYRRYDEGNIYPRPHARNVDPGWPRVPRNNEMPWGIDRFAQGIERVWNRWVNRDYNNHTPDSDFSW